MVVCCREELAHLCVNIIINYNINSLSSVPPLFSLLILANKGSETAVNYEELSAVVIRLVQRAVELDL